MEFDAEGLELGERCPRCESSDTVTYVYNEGFSELECRVCGYSSETEGVGDLTRYRGDLKERGDSSAALPPIPVKKLEA